MKQKKKKKNEEISEEDKCKIQDSNGLLVWKRGAESQRFPQGFTGGAVSWMLSITYVQNIL